MGTGGVSLVSQALQVLEFSPAGLTLLDRKTYADGYVVPAWAEHWVALQVNELNILGSTPFVPITFSSSRWVAARPALK